MPEVRGWGLAIWPGSTSTLGDSNNNHLGDATTEPTEIRTTHLKQSLAVGNSYLCLTTYLGFSY